MITDFSVGMMCTCGKIYRTENVVLYVQFIIVDQIKGKY